MRLLLSELWLSRRPARSWADIERDEQGEDGHEPFELDEAMLAHRFDGRKTLVGIPAPAILSGKPPFPESKS